MGTPAGRERSRLSASTLLTLGFWRISIPWTVAASVRVVIVVLLLSDGWARAQEVSNRFLPPPRSLLQQLGRGRQAIQNGQWHEAVEALGQVLAPETREGAEVDLDQDYFIQVPEAGGAMPSLRQEAQRLIGSLPPVGRQLYELRYGAAAKALLEEAIRENDIRKLTDVTRKYFHTQAGYQAMLLLGRRYLEEGRPAAAALCLDRLAAQPAAVALLEPELTLLRSYCRSLSGDTQRAAQLIVDLQRRATAGTMKLGSEVLPRFSDQAQAEAWWASRVPAFAGNDQSGDWLLYRGSASRNAASVGGTPISTPRWRVPVANDPEDESLLSDHLRYRLGADLSLVGALQPLAVGDVILMRTTDKLLAVDLASGKRIWEFPWDETPEERAVRMVQGQPTRGAASPRMWELAERLWMDAPYGQLASDSKNVYLLHELGSSIWAASPMLIAGGGVAITNPRTPKPYNKLVALNLARQGALRWIVGGPDGGDEPQLANAFFLGPPLPLMAQLFVLAEVTGELRLVVLDPESGKLLWQQQLAHVDNLTIDVDGVRRLAGATPSYADGILVCPTSAGAVVALDVSTRSLLWGYQYPTSNPISGPAIAAIRVNRGNVFGANAGEEFTGDSTVTVGEGVAVLMPVESDQLICLDLVTGVPRWPPKKREGTLYVACIHQGKIILVGKRTVSAISIADGSAAWADTVSLSDAVVSGRGFWSGNFYYLPTSTGHLHKIDLNSGHIVESVDMRMPLGNVIAYRDQVISLSPDSLTAYYQVEALERWVNARLAENPNDREALARKCDLLLQRKQRREAIDTMWTLYRTDPQDESIKAQLVTTYLTALQEEFAAYVDMRAQMEPLIDQPAHRAAYLRTLAVGLQQMQRWDEAFGAVLELADQWQVGSKQGEQLEQVDRHWSVSPRRWVQGRVAALWAATEGEQFATVRAHWHTQLEQRLQQALRDGSRQVLRSFLDQFAPHPLARQARLAYARRLIGDGEFLSAELQLSSLLSDSDSGRLAEDNASVLALLAELYVRTQRWGEAVVCVGLLEQLPASTKLDTGQTVGDFLARLSKEPSYQNVVNWRKPWPYSRVSVTEELNAQPNVPIPLYQYVVPVEETRGIWAEGITAVSDLRSNSILVRDPYGTVTHQALLNPSGAQFGAMYNLARARAAGHLLVVVTPPNLIVIDTLRNAVDSQENVLWRADLAEGLPNAQRRLGQRTLRDPWQQSGVRPVVTDASPQRVPLTTSVVVTASGLCYMKYRQLICADPLTGEALWVRDGLDAGMQLYGDDRYLFVVGYDQTEAMVLDTATGEFLGKRPAERMENRWATWGTHVLAWREESNKLLLRLYDAWQQRELWRCEFAQGARGTLVGSDEVAVFDPSGLFVVVSIRQGRELWRTRLEPVVAPTTLFVQRTPEAYFVMPGSALPPNVRAPNISLGSGGIQVPVVRGYLYALDRRSGQSLWPTPAYLDGYAIPVQQPAQLPVLCFARGIPQTNNTRATRIVAALAVLDKRDGRLLYGREDLPLVQPNVLTLETQGNPEQGKVEVLFAGHKVALQWTDDPIPPAPPEQGGGISGETGQ